MGILYVLKHYLPQLHGDEKAASAIEYAIIAGLIAVAIIVTVSTLGGDMDDIFSFISDELEKVDTTGSGT